MRFSDPALITALATWRGTGGDDSRAKGDNLWFEERVAAARQSRFEDVVGGAATPDDFRRRHIDYVGQHVNVDRPDTFDPDLGPLPLGTTPLDTEQRIVRMDRIREDVLRKSGLTVDQLMDAWSNRRLPLLDRFLTIWNVERDGRPTFAAWKDEVRHELAAADWADRLRDRLGLAHYSPAGSPIAVMLMEYRVADVLAAALAAGWPISFVAPTALDSGPWPWFFPSPAGLHYGRTVALRPGPAALLTEVLHTRMDYARDHIARIGMISEPLDPGLSVRERRNDHLAVLRRVSARPDFGEVM